MQTVTKPQQPPQQRPGSAPPPGREKKKSRRGLALGVLAALAVLGFVAVLQVQNKLSISNI